MLGTIKGVRPCTQVEEGCLDKVKQVDTFGLPPCDSSNWQYSFCLDVANRLDMQTAADCIMLHEHMVVRITFSIWDRVATLDVTMFYCFI